MSSLAAVAEAFGGSTAAFDLAAVFCLLGAILIGATWPYHATQRTSACTMSCNKKTRTSRSSEALFGFNSGPLAAGRSATQHRGNALDQSATLGDKTRTCKSFPLQIAAQRCVTRTPRHVLVKFSGCSAGHDRYGLMNLCSKVDVLVNAAVH